MNNDEIITAYRLCAHNGSFEDRQLSRDFHRLFRQTIALAESRGWISFPPQTSNFWKDLIDTAPDK